MNEWIVDVGDDRNSHHHVFTQHVFIYYLDWWAVSSTQTVIKQWMWWTCGSIGPDFSSSYTNKKFNLLGLFVTTRQKHHSRFRTYICFTISPHQPVSSSEVKHYLSDQTWLQSTSPAATPLCLSMFWPPCRPSGIHTHTLYNQTHAEQITLFTSIFLCSFLILTGDKDQKIVLIWRGVKWAIADNEASYYRKQQSSGLVTVLKLDILVGWPVTDSVQIQILELYNDKGSERSMKTSCVRFVLYWWTFFARDS